MGYDCKVTITVFCDTTHFDSFSLSAPLLHHQQVIIRARDSSQPGHIRYRTNRIDAAAAGSSGPGGVAGLRVRRMRWGARYNFPSVRSVWLLPISLAFLSQNIASRHIPWEYHGWEVR
eukprot:COSAG02_NODE_8700_length_2475_cov_3.240741_1_plen_118_part_00